MNTTFPNGTPSFLAIHMGHQPGERVIVTLRGRLDTHTYLECEKRLAPVIASPKRVLVFDMAGLEYISSMGLRVLMKTSKALAAMKGKCLLTRLTPPIKAVIDIANALPAENVFASVAEADQYLDLMQQQAMETVNKADCPPTTFKHQT